MIRADSIRQTASTAPCVSVAVTCQMTTPGSAPAQPVPDSLLAVALVLGQDRGVEVGQLGDPADLDLVVEHLAQPGRPFQRLVQVADLDQHEAADQLLRL